MTIQTFVYILTGNPVSGVHLSVNMAVLQRLKHLWLALTDPDAFSRA